MKRVWRENDDGANPGSGGPITRTLTLPAEIAAILT